MAIQRHLVIVTVLGCSAPSDRTPPADDTAFVETGETDTPHDTATTGPIDADGDGSVAEEDCDDNNAGIHPGAVDVCDGVDQDCDGAVVAEGGCGEPIDAEEAASVVFEWSGGYAGLDCTWSTSRGDVLVDHTGFVKTGQGGFAIYAWEEDDLGEALAITTDAEDTFEHCTVVGDFDGDGNDDLALHGGSVEYSTVGRLVLVSGDSTGWPTTLVSVDDIGFAGWVGLYGGDQFSEELAQGDIDGDGLADIVTHAPADVGDDGGGKSGWLFVIPGRTSNFPYPLDSDAIQDEWYYRHSQDSASDTPVDEAFVVEAVHPDLDGDGLGDLIANGPYGSYVILHGATLTTQQGAHIEDIVDVQSEVTGTYALFDAGACVDRDLDGDGVADCLAQLTGEPAGGALVVVSGSGLADGADPLDAALTTFIPGDWTDAQTLRDIDGDGTADIGLTHPTDLGTQCVLASSRLELGGTVEVAAPCWQHADEIGYLTGSAVADLDGSGLPDLALSQRLYEWGNAPIYVLLDPDLPWEDPTRW